MPGAAPVCSHSLRGLRKQSEAALPEPTANAAAAGLRLACTTLHACAASQPPARPSAPAAALSCRHSVQGAAVRKWLAGRHECPLVLGRALTCSPPPPSSAAPGAFRAASPRAARTAWQVSVPWALTMVLPIPGRGCAGACLRSAPPLCPALCRLLVHVLAAHGKPLPAGLCLQLNEPPVCCAVKVVQSRAGGTMRRWLRFANRAARACSSGLPCRWALPKPSVWPCLVPLLRSSSNACLCCRLSSLYLHRLLLCSQRNAALALSYARRLPLVPSQLAS